MIRSRSKHESSHAAELTGDCDGSSANSSRVRWILRAVYASANGKYATGTSHTADINNVMIITADVL